MKGREHIYFGKTKIDFSIEYKERKSMTIQVHPDKSVKLIAPLDSKMDMIKAKVKKKASWIIKQQDFFLSFHPLTPRRKYISGETHLYLGRQYRLKVIEQEEEKVKLQGANIWVFTKSKSDTSRVKKLLNKWYTEKANLHFNILFKAIQPQFDKYKVAIPFLQIRWMTKRWGSCGIDGKILLNTELIKAPKVCIEYVVTHEMCHLVQADHSQKFFKVLEYHYPEWRKVKDRLERFMV